METGDVEARRPALLLGVIAACFAIGVGAAIAARAPLEYDEAVYAVQARAWAEATPATGIAEYRPPGLPAIGAPLIALGGGERVLRTTGLVFGVITVLGVYALGSSVSGSRAGLIAAGAFAAAHTVQARSAQFLTDVPATALLVLCALTIVVAVRRRRWVLLPAIAAPLAAGAYYLRYGSALPVALLGLMALVIWREQLPTRWLLAAASVLAVLLAPHLIESTISFGAPWKRASFAVHAAGRTSVVGGIADYATWLPFALAGPLAGIVMIAALVRAAVPRLRTSGGRALGFLVVTALAHMILLGAIAHGEARFVFFPVALLCVAGAGAAAAGIPSSLNGAVAVVLVLALAGGGIAAVHTTHDAGARRAGVAEAARAAAAAVTGPCVLAATSRETEIAWYSGCAVHRFARLPPGVRPTAGIAFEADPHPTLPEGATLTDVFPTGTGGLAAVYAFR